MTEPTASRPVPGPFRPGPRPVPVPARDAASAPDAAPEGEPIDAADAPTGEGADTQRALAGLTELPVAEHVAVFEAEHARLQRELGTIDPR
ncbi:hypothetical protein [Blastococcus sp. SYSU DS0973]